MEVINLQAIPNQQVSYQADSNFFVLTFKEINGLMAVDINMNQNDILLGQRCVSDCPLIPYEYLGVNNGNFVIVTQNESYPYYTQFGITQYLTYQSALEIQAIINATANTTA